MATTTITDTDPAPEQAGEESEEKSESFTKMAAQLKQNMAEVERGTQPDAAPEAKLAPAEAPPAKPEPAKTETKPPAEAKPEVKPEPELPEAIKKGSGKAAQEFRNLRTTLTSEIEAKAKALSDAQDELKRAKEQLEAASKTPSVDPDAHTKLKQERDEYATLLEKVALEQSPSFKSRYEKRQETAAQAAAQAAGDKKDVVLGLLELPPSDSRRKQLSAIVKDMEMSDAMALTIAFNEMDKIRSDRASELGNHREVLQREREQEALRAQEQQAIAKASKDHMLKQVLQIAPTEFEAFKRTGKPEDDAIVADYEKDVAKFISGEMTPAEAAFIPVMAAEGMHLKSRVLPALKAENEQLKAQIAQMTKSVPDLGSTSEAREDAGDTKNSFIQKFKQAESEIEN